MKLRNSIGQVVATLLIDSALGDVPFSTVAAAYNAGALGNSPNQTFRSTPIVAPILQITTFQRDSADKALYLFID